MFYIFKNNKNFGLTVLKSQKDVKEFEKNNKEAGELLAIEGLPFKIFQKLSKDLGIFGAYEYIKKHKIVCL